MGSSISSVVVLLVGNDEDRNDFIDIVQVWGNINCSGCIRNDEEHSTSLVIEDNSKRTIKFVCPNNNSLEDVSLSKRENNIEDITYVLQFNNCDTYIKEELNLVNIISDKTIVLDCERFTITYKNDDRCFYDAGYNLSKMVGDECVSVCEGLTGRRVAMYLRDGYVCP